MTEYNPSALTSEQHQHFYALLAHLADTPDDGSWQDWYITRILGGANNILYRVRNLCGDFAVKFSIRDTRDRAGREYHTLLAVQQMGLALAPVPVLLEQTAFVSPVVVQTWLDGENSLRLPADQAEWRQLMAHYATIRTVTPDKIDIPLNKAVVNCHSIASGISMIQTQLRYIPAAEQPPELVALVEQVDRFPSPDWSDAPVTLCRVDPNLSNFVRRSEVWASVDWENSGWGDPAFEIADIMTHPAYEEVEPDQWETVIEIYCQLVDDTTASHRIRVYYYLSLVWWLARFTRFLYEVPRGLDERLVARPANWLAGTEAKYQRYLTRTHLVGRQTWGL